jgi:hypothetical protein
VCERERERERQNVGARQRSIVLKPCAEKERKERRGARAVQADWPRRQRHRPPLPLCRLDAPRERYVRGKSKPGTGAAQVHVAPDVGADPSSSSSSSSSSDSDDSDTSSGSCSSTDSGGSSSSSSSSSSSGSDDEAEEGAGNPNTSSNKDLIAHELSRFVAVARSEPRSRLYQGYEGYYCQSAELG